MKYFIWLVVALAIIVWFQRVHKFIKPGAGSASGNRHTRDPLRRRSKQVPESMVQCAHCGIHFPASESVTAASGMVFCSDEHLRLASPA